MSSKNDIQEFLHIRTKSQFRSQMGDSTQTSYTGTGSLATVNEAVVTATAASSTSKPTSINKENTERNASSIAYIFCL